MLPCMNYCTECRKFSMKILAYYRGKMMCESCKRKLMKEEEKAENSRRTPVRGH